MPKFRFNHMELSFAKGTLTQQFRDEVDAFYGDVLGWRTLDTEVIGQLCHLLLPDDGQFILLAEGKDPISSPGYDHLGLSWTPAKRSTPSSRSASGSRRRTTACASRSTRIWSSPTVTTHAFYVKYLLPIWFDVQCIERTSGPAPERSWQYV